MKQRLQFGLLMALSAAMALPCAAQSRNPNRPPQQPKAAARPAQKQGRPPQAPRGGQNGRPNNNRPHNNAPANRPNEAAVMRNDANPVSNPSGQSARQPNLNTNRPPNGAQPAPKRYQDLSPAEKRSYDQYSKLPPQKQQEMRDRVRQWQKLTPEQQNHIKNDVLPAWKQLPPDRRGAIQSRLNVLQNMPESARNQHLNDPNFTRGMNEQDKTMLHDLSHMHVGAPDPPNE